MTTALIIISLIVTWILLEVVIRIIAEKGVATDFYGSISRADVLDLQNEVGLKVMQGDGWFHLGWIADPENEHYHVQTHSPDGNWVTISEVPYGSWLGHEGPGHYRVLAISNPNSDHKVLGQIEIRDRNNARGKPKSSKPSIAEDWKYLFKPEKSGDYINDHCLYKDADENWRIMGITSQGKGDYQKEKHFAVGVGRPSLKEGNFIEDVPVVLGNDLAWAPFVISCQGVFHLFWSPHKLYHTTSKDGIHWENVEVVLEKPFHKFFRDAMIYEVAPGQWLMYATGRGKWFSRIDIYQSFDLVHWQYIRPAINSTWGSERNFVSGSMESPFLIDRNGQFLLSITYNNESFFLGALLLQFKIFLNKKAYNDTLIFSALSPYSFGVYRGKKSTPELLTHLECHAPVYIETENGWYITTCGWPFAATLTKGEAAYTRLEWKEQEKP